MENKTVKVKKKVSFKKKVTKFFKRLKKLGLLMFNELKSIWNKFKELPKKTKLIIYVWSVVFLILVIIIIAGHSNNVFLDDYKKLETDMNAAVIKYAERKKIFVDKDNRQKIDIEVLIEEELLDDDSKKELKCEGFSFIYYKDTDEKYVAESYINCENYTTEGYSDYK